MIVNINRVMNRLAAAIICRIIGFHGFFFDSSSSFRNLSTESFDSLKALISLSSLPPLLVYSPVRSFLLVLAVIFFPILRGSRSIKGSSPCPFSDDSIDLICRWFPCSCLVLVK